MRTSPNLVEAYTLRIMAVDPSPIFISGLRVSLEEHSLSLAGAACNQADALTLAKTLNPKIALVAIRLAAQHGGTIEYPNGVRTVALMRAASPDLHILVTALEPEPYWVLEAVRAGASGLVRKDVAPDDLVQAVLAVARGEVVLSEQLLVSLVSKTDIGLYQLTEREMTVLRLLAQGYTNRQIGDHLSISVGTARTHVANILGKFGVSGRRAAVDEARRRGLV